MCVVDDGLGQTKEHIKVFPAFFVKVGTCQSCSYFNQTKKGSTVVWRTNGFHQIPVGQRVFRLMANRTN